MEFNPSKCQVLHIIRSRQPLQSQYTLHGQGLESVDSSKYLGVNISSDLNGYNQINEITGKANRTLGYVKRNVKTKNEAVKEPRIEIIIVLLLSFRSGNHGHGRQVTSFFSQSEAIM